MPSEDFALGQMRNNLSTKTRQRWRPAERAALGCLATAACILACATDAVADGSSVVAVPFVGCPTSGWSHAAPPAPAGPSRIVPAALAPRLAYYASRGLGVLAPRGWHCSEVYGSGGARLLVTPDPETARQLRPVAPTEPAVAVTWHNGANSGRFVVAPIAAGLFPVARAFVQSVIDLDLVPADELAYHPHPEDRLTRRSDTVVEFTTPADRDGLGTSAGPLSRGTLPIHGVAMLIVTDVDLAKVDIRLPDAMVDLAPAILGQAEMDKGLSDADPCLEYGYDSSAHAVVCQRWRAATFGSAR
jgi:hypothetical protein